MVRPLGIYYNSPEYEVHAIKKENRFIESDKRMKAISNHKHEYFGNVTTDSDLEESVYKTI